MSADGGEWPLLPDTPAACPPARLLQVEVAAAEAEQQQGGLCLGPGGAGLDAHNTLTLEAVVQQWQVGVALPRSRGWLAAGQEGGG